MVSEFGLLLDRSVDLLRDFADATRSGNRDIKL